jgi:hypothetical protein
MRSDGRMNGPARGDGRANRQRWSGRPFRLRRGRFFARRFLPPGSRRAVSGGRGFGIHYSVRLGMSVGDRRHFDVGGGAVLRGGFVPGGRSRRILMPVVDAELVHHVIFQRAGVRLFISNAQFGELLQYFVSFDFQLPRQLVDSDLSHR